MLVEEYPYQERTDRIRHYSDAGFSIIQVETGIEFGEAIDVYPCPYTYIESDTPPEPEEEATPEQYDAQLERLGVTND